LKNLPSNRERVLNANHDAQALLKALRSKQNGAKAPESQYAKIADFLKGMEALTKDLLLTPLQTDWQAELAAIRKDMQDTKTAVEPPARQTVRSFADQARMAPAPVHYLSSSSSSGSAPARASDIARDREVVVCLGDRSQVSLYRRMTSAELTKRANQVRAKAALSARDPTPALAQVMILASRQLKSGDIRFTVRDAKEAEILRVPTTTSARN
jgi:hypothetical protein